MFADIFKQFKDWKDTDEQMVMPDDMFDPIFEMFVPLNGADESLLSIKRGLSTGELEFNLDKDNNWTVGAELAGVGHVNLSLDGSVNMDFSHDWDLPPCSMGSRTIGVAISNPSLSGADASSVRVKMGPLGAQINADHLENNYLSEFAASFPMNNGVTSRVGVQAEHSLEESGPLRLFGAVDIPNAGASVAFMKAFNSGDEVDSVLATVGLKKTLNDETELSVGVKQLNRKDIPFVGLASVHRDLSDFTYFPTSLVLGTSTEKHLGGAVNVQLGGTELNLSFDKQWTEKVQFGLCVAL